MRRGMHIQVYRANYPPTRRDMVGDSGTVEQVDQNDIVYWSSRYCASMRASLRDVRPVCSLPAQVELTDVLVRQGWSVEGSNTFRHPSGVECRVVFSTDPRWSIRFVPDGVVRFVKKLRSYFP